MSTVAATLGSFEDSNKRFQQAADNYRHAMSNEESRDEWIVNYLPLVKSIVNRLRYHSPENF